MPKFVLFWTDAFVFIMLVAAIIYCFRARSSVALRSAWASVARTSSAMCAAVILLLFLIVGVLDSIHYRPQLPSDNVSTPIYSPVAHSVLDGLLGLTQLPQREKTYSAPLAIHQFTKESQIIDGETVRDFPRLQFAGSLLENESDHLNDVMYRLAMGILYGLILSVFLAFLLSVLLRKTVKKSQLNISSFSYWWHNKGQIPWRAMYITASLVIIIFSVIISLSVNYHVLGTDRTGNDVLWQCLKSIRTALVIGTLTTVAMLPPALGFGVAAGYFKGRVDDVIQYIYTTLTSIPGVLLIAASVMMLQVYIDANADLFTTVAARADLRLFMLCLILGFTGWAGLCRLLRAETLKLRELEYVQAARAFGVSNWRIMRKHLLPNVMHIVLITLVLEFSGLVLYEAVLSYLGIGVDPSMNSFGTMIDAARLEMSRDPMIWWNLLGAFLFLLILVLAANVFADAVQTAFDPRTRRFKPLALAAKAGK